MYRDVLSSAAFFAAVLLAAGVASAGDLNPPPGPVVPSMKTLDEVRPGRVVNDTNTPGTLTSRHRIGQSGVFYLDGNVLAGDEQHGIEIAASDVTLDLGGFTVLGAGLFAPNTLDGITVSGARSNITIRNGVVREFDLAGIGLAGAMSVTLENVSVVGCGGDGISVGDGSLVSSCTVRNNQGHGITLGRGSVVESCAVSVSGMVGIRLGRDSVCRACTLVGNGVRSDVGLLDRLGIEMFTGSLVESCTVAESGSIGVFGRIEGAEEASYTVRDTVARLNGDSGFNFLAGALIERCNANGNADFGIVVAEGGVVTSCHATLNGSDGFRGGEGALFSGCTSIENGETGFTTFSSSTFESCLARENTGDGFVIFFGGTVQSCTSEGNGANGFTGTAHYVACTSFRNMGDGFDIAQAAFTPGRVEGCVASLNSGAGIIVNRETPVLNNQCARNGGPGIQAASANTISGNLSAVNGTGYLVTGSENLLTGNFARGNGLNWDIAGGNGCRVAVVSDTGAFSGNSGGTAVGASDPFLNFTQ